MARALRERRARQRRQRQAYNECGRKQGFPTLEDALANIGNIPSTRPNQMWHAYKCTFCDWYHTGHKRMNFDE